MSRKTVSTGVRGGLPGPHPGATRKSPPAAQKNAVLGRRTCERPPHPKQACHLQLWEARQQWAVVSPKHCVLLCEGESPDAAAGGRSDLH